MMPARPLVVINIVGLTHAMLGQHTPCLNRLLNDGFSVPVECVFPALTCPAQASMLTGSLPNRHGIVANGWYFRDLAEVYFWRQSNRLMAGEKVWDSLRARYPEFTCAQLFWWYNMYARVDWSLTPRPIYPADGRKIPALYSSPPSLHEGLEARYGEFPFFKFWGPAAGIESSRWIAACAQHLFNDKRPALTLVYLPHLDYNLQRLGPHDPGIWRDVAEIDAVAGALIDHVRGKGAAVMVVSEYGIEEVAGHVHINRVLRRAGLLAVRKTLDWEILDYGASRAFAVADHQIAHVYVRDRRDLGRVRRLLVKTPGIEAVLDEDEQKDWQVGHERAGELLAIADKGCWFTYYYWLDDDRAPDFARTVDIHRKPGYDPLELFMDPDLAAPRLKLAWRLAQKRLGLRTLMDVIPLQAELVKGSHGRLEKDPLKSPLLICSERALARKSLHVTDVKGLICRHFQRDT